MTTKITPINRILKYGEQVSILTYLAATIFIVIAFFIAYSFGIELYVFLALLAFPLLWVMLNYPRVWIYCVVLTFPVFFINDDAGLTPTSVMGALFYNLFLICWLINRLFFRPVIASETKQSICNSKEIATPTARNDGKNKVNNSDASRSEIAKSNFASKKQLIGCDVLILLFYVLVLFNSVIAYSNGVEPFDWLSEYLLYSLLLYYFPIREYFDDKKSIITLLSLLFISAFILDIQQFYGYKNQIMKAALAYQLGGWGNINHQIYTASVIAGVTFLFYSKTVKGRLFAFVISVFSTAAIISTFARAFWLSLILVLFLLLFFLNYKQIIKLFIVLIVTAGLIGTALYMIFPKQAKLITKYATNRFSSSTKGKSDISVRSRFYEYREVISKIKESPLGGQGLRKKFSFYSPIAKHTIEYSFVHNGYLNMAYRVGIPLAALFYSVLLSFMIKGFIISYKLRKYSADWLLFTRKTSLGSFTLQSTSTTGTNHEVHSQKANEQVINSQLAVGLAICGTLSLCMLFITNFITSSFVFRDGLLVSAFSIAFIGIAEKKLREIV